MLLANATTQDIAEWKWLPILPFDRKEPFKVWQITVAYFFSPKDERVKYYFLGFLSFSYFVLMLFFLYLIPFLSLCTSFDDAFSVTQTHNFPFVPNWNIGPLSGFL
jgi:hypothetical protein